MVSFREVVLHEQDRQFLLASSRDARLRNLLESASSESLRAPYVRISLTLEEQEDVVEVLEGLIDIFNPQR